ncbi:hypothetical protein MANES_09G157350v8 [Manihot esculenta]|uniref:Uncharacterized protein n=1 Tax=Manihot esculenta TaxID=3983 RepID=A0ACB7H6Q0_MANES|nr:hypothetical protein MANES_09G157350v8 [Manihot esculenta]
MAKRMIRWFILSMLVLQIQMIQTAMASICLHQCEEDCNNDSYPFLCKVFCPPYCAVHLEHLDPNSDIVSETSITKPEDEDP